MRLRLDLKFPYTFFMEKHDYQVSYKLAKAYLDSIEAPQKGFFTFEESAHSPNLEDVEQFVEVIRAIAEK